MDFFDDQQRARRASWVYLGLFLLALAGTIAAVYFVLAVCHTLVFSHELPRGIPWNPPIFVVVTQTVLLLVGCAAAIKISQLSGGGRVVAERLGGRRVSPDTEEPCEKRAVNVVEEMAVASGCPAPTVFLLDRDDGINAFAAGKTTGDAVIGLTLGAVERLSRDELQAVVAHEFSHILNGDMRLNIRLIGATFGLQVLSLGGRWVFTTRHPGLIVVFLPFVVIGSIGTFFSRLMVGAISRRREYLADASAIEFTRNPAALIGAFRKIAACPHGSRVRSFNAQEASHIFFGGITTRARRWLFSTHPPIEHRLGRVEEKFPAASLAATAEDSAGAEVEPAARDLSTLLARIGSADPAGLGHARKLLAQIPKELAKAMHDPESVRAVVYALLLDADSGVREQQREILERREPGERVEKTERLRRLLRRVDHAVRLPIADLALPTLALVPPDERTHFLRTCDALIRAESGVHLFEIALEQLLRRHLGEAFGRRNRPAPSSSLSSVADECFALLGGLARTQRIDPVAGAEAWAAGLDQVGLQCPPSKSDRPVTPSPISPEGFRRAIRALARLRPHDKRRVLRACAICLAHDGAIPPDELDLLRVIADGLGCPGALPIG